MRILLADDDRAMAELLRQGLQENGHQVIVAFNGVDALSLAQENAFDLLVLDVMMPGLDGFSVARRLRENQNQTPVLMLTARDAMEDVVQGLDLGADDYITKPFAFDVLLARIRALARRGPIVQSPVLRVADLVLDPAVGEVYRGGQPLELTPTEYKLLELLMRRAGKVVRREVLLQTVWGFDCVVESNTLHAFIRLLRHKIDTPGNRLIHTVRGVGYRFRAPGE